MPLRLYDSWKDLPAAYEILFERAGVHDFCLTRAWFETLATTTLGPDERLRMAALERDGRPRACLIGCHRERDRALCGARVFRSLSNFYTLRYGPLVLGPDPEGLLAELIGALCRERPRYAALHFEPLAPEGSLAGHLEGALRNAGLVTRRYFRFGNWYEDTQGLGFEDYLARRPAALRNTLRRKSARLTKAGPVKLTVARDGAELERGLDAYQEVHAASWKPAEPYPAFVGRLASTFAQLDAIRLPVLYLGGRPIAAQIWVLWRGKATLYKLAHDRASDEYSPGSLLTLRMLEHLFEEERIGEIDLGAGDDPYKRLWASRRRERCGLIAFDRHSVRGGLGALRHVLLPRVKEGLGV